MAELDLSKITKGQIKGLLRGLERFAETPKPNKSPKGTRRMQFRTIAQKAQEFGFTDLTDIGMDKAQIDAVQKGKPAKSTVEQRQTLAAIVAGAARRCHVKVPADVAQHFNV
jgi:hypothetical protein